ncbi:unnamed protein product, partial [Mesorhabditis spiculigera]
MIAGFLRPPPIQQNRIPKNGIRRPQPYIGRLPRPEPYKRRVKAFAKKFEVLREVGSGGFGHVDKIKLKKDGKVCALKTLDFLVDKTAIRAEFRALTLLHDKPFIIKTYALMRLLDRFFVLMDYVDPIRLRDLVPLFSHQDAMIYVQNILAALAQIHRLGIIHNDIKPANILYDPIRRKFAIIDFGLASFHDTERRIPVFYPRPAQIYSDNWYQGADDAELLITQAHPFLAQQAHLEFAKKALEHRQARDIEYRYGFAVELFKGLAELNPDGYINRLANASPDVEEALLHEGPRTEQDWEFLVAFQGHLPPREYYEARLEAVEKDFPCSCFNQLGICNFCKGQRGFTSCDWGTRGYKPPEVELRFEWRSEAIDLWATGMILLGILLRKLPVFRPDTHGMALLQLSTLFGYERMRALANKYGRNLVMKIKPPGLDLLKLTAYHEFCRSGSPIEAWTFSDCCETCYELIEGNDSGLCICRKGIEGYKQMKDGLGKELFRLLHALLLLDPVKRNRGDEFLAHCEEMLRLNFDPNASGLSVAKIQALWQSKKEQKKRKCAPEAARASAEEKENAPPAKRAKPC